jgi:CRP/FNR family transcriptional regulator
MRGRIKAGRIARIYKANQVIFSPGDGPQGLLIICRGSVRLAFTTQQGRQVTVGYASCGEVIGEAAYLAGANHVFTAEALGDTFVTFLPKPLADEILSRSPALMRRMAENSSGRFCAMAQLATNWLLKSADAKLAEFLLSGPATSRGSLPCMPNLRLSRRSVAEYVGLAPETVIRRLSAFKRRGLVRYAGRSVEVVDRQAMREVACDGTQASVSFAPSLGFLSARVDHS